MPKKITIHPVTRIEGHAKITLECDENGEVLNGHLHVLELRGFEKLVEGMELSKMPLITGRICGVCPAAHHLASVTAIENGCGVTAPPAALELRQLLYMGHILHSHALSCFVLIGPDLFQGIHDRGDTRRGRSIFQLLSETPEFAVKALRLRSIGQKIVEKVGGRGIHPVTAIPGGMAASPAPEEISTMLGWGREALLLTKELYPVLKEKIEAIKQLRGITRLGMKAVALSDDSKVGYLSGSARIVDAEGNIDGAFSGNEYGQYLKENVVSGSYMKSVRLAGGDSFFVGPLARLLVNDSFSTPEAAHMLGIFKTETGKEWAAMDAIEARSIEMVHCAERIVEICSAMKSGGALALPCVPKEGRYRSLIEAPRGILIHDYTADADGLVTAANLVVATQNNYDAIDATITALARHYMVSGDEGSICDAMEFAVRCFDPCLSCATHVAGRMALRIELYNNDTLLRTITRGERS